MNKNISLIGCVVVLMMLQGCAGTSSRSGGTSGRSLEEQRMLDMQAYQPYVDQNTIAGYEAFISAHPENSFAGDARRRIDNLRFAEVEKMDTLEGYREFLDKYPHSSRVKDAQRKITRIEFRNCQKENTPAAYQAFVAKHPDSYLADDARLWMQEHAFKQLDRKLIQQHDFDLLLYRLALRRLRRDLLLENREKLAAFKLGADFGVYGGEKYFRTLLINPSSNTGPAPAAAPWRPPCSTKT